MLHSRHGAIILSCGANAMYVSSKRTCDGGTEKVLSFVHRARFNQRPEIAGYEFVAKVFDITFGCPGPQRLFFNAVQFIILADVAGHSDDFTTIVFLEPRNDDGRVQTAGVR